MGLSASLNRAELYTENYQCRMAAGGWVTAGLRQLLTHIWYDVGWEVPSDAHRSCPMVPHS